MKYLYDNKNVLVVGESDSEGDTISSKLGEMGFNSQNVKSANSFQQAFELLNEGKFNLIVSDFNAGGMELLKSIREDDRLKSIPFLVISSEENKEKELLEAGANGCIDSPFKEEVLKKAIQKIMLETLVILVVDDSEFFREVLKDILSELKFKTILEGADGLEGLEQIRLAREKGIDIDLVVCDWEMPQMNGLVFLKMLKDNPKTENIPFIILTAHNDKARVLEAVKCGATDYIIKPSLEDLGAKIDKIFEIQV